MNALEERQKLIKEVVKPIFKNVGFRTSGNKFMKIEDGFIKLFSIENDSWNEKDYASFTFFVGILFPVIENLKGGKIPQFPSAYGSHFYCVINRLSNSPRLSVIDRNTDIEEFRQFITDTLNKHVIPFFDELKKVEDCTKLETIVPDNKLNLFTYIGLTLIEKGNIVGGNKMIDDGLKYLDNVRPEYAEIFKKFIEDSRESLLLKQVT